MEFRTQLSQKDYVAASLVILYRRPFVFIVTFLLLITLGVNTSLLLMGYRMTPDTVALPVVFLFVMPFSTYLTARRNFRTNKAAGDPLVYTFEGSKMKVVGTGVQSEKNVSELRKVFKTGKWLFIMHSSKAVNPVLLEQISEDQLPELKQILDANNVRNNL